MPCESEKRRSWLNMNAHRSKAGMSTSGKEDLVGILEVVKEGLAEGDYMYR